ncbi:hypothetical protein HF313_22620 [Massilia atriviolacea]|uniref:Uncharacterized protein n=1 Tax=Massilia atriviolacea TaxID=2495579 RepID=A0A430HFP6_9BURK|nr:hypothetical protein [Massilia atriviolacea]RSZ56327.1 hypothetical protein EJB06_24700 [Massilia atriviolacea]
MNHVLTRGLLAAALAALCAGAQAQTPAASPQALAELAKAAPHLVAALECRKKLVYTDAVKVFIKDPNSFDEVVLPAPLTVFGIKTSTINVTEDDQNGGGGYNARFTGLSQKDAARAARVKGPGYKRHVKGGGMIEVGTTGNAASYIACIYGAGEG